METVRRQPQTHGGSSPIHHHHARERSRQVWRGSPVAGHSLSREFHRFAIESGIVCVTAVPGIGFRSQAPPTPAAAVPRHPNEHDAGPPSRGCRLALGVGLGEAAAASTTSQPGGGGVGSIHSPKRPTGPGPRTITGCRVAQETECDKAGVSHSTADG